MVAARQYRKSHLDAYYAAAVFHYEKEFAVKFQDISSSVKTKSIP